ncbi:hypothetical protein [Methanoculleus sp.]|jgi:hypothetical protein|uniref:hypothetical protein n=1 Tax=Methanoculleus sp. TaxID=90427 RepID=UPI0025EEA188|nr:hypothetical protein [Methanoculleus sp.]MCK9319496.1 hypothetical protein [Methanoculleus sp.]
MIQEVIRTSIENKLNDNTKNKKFVVGSYAYLEDKDQHFVYNIKQGYKLIEANYIPTMITFSASYQALPEQINGVATIGVEFLVKSDYQQELETDLETLDEFIPKIVGNYEDLVDNATTYHTVWNMDALLPAGITSPVNGNYYTRIQTTIYVEFSDTNLFGNAYRYYLDSNLLTLYDGGVSRENEENYPHKQGDYEAKGGLTTSQWNATLVCYVDDNVATIIEGISSNTYDMEQKYTYKETKNGSDLHTFAVKIQSMSRPILLGEKQYVSISLIKSDEDIVY